MFLEVAVGWTSRCGTKTYTQRKVEKYHGVENVQCCSLQFLILFHDLFHHLQSEAKVSTFSERRFRVVLGFKVFLMTTADRVELKSGLSVHPLALRTLCALRQESSPGRALVSFAVSSWISVSGGVSCKMPCETGEV